MLTRYINRCELVRSRECWPSRSPHQEGRAGRRRAIRQAWVEKKENRKGEPGLTGRLARHTGNKNAGPRAALAHCVMTVIFENQQDNLVIYA